MALPETRCNPYQTILEAGQLRRQASQIADRAAFYEQAAMAELDLDATAPHTKTLMPGTTLVLAYGGVADGEVTRMPTEQLSTGIKLVVVKTGGNVSALPHSYQPTQIIQLGPHVAGALVVPKGQVAAAFDELRHAKLSDPLPCAIAKLLHLAIGFNTELIQGVTAQFMQAARDCEVASESPMLMQVN